MASYTFDPTVPPNTESPRNGATRIRNLALNILAMLNLPTGGGSQTVAGPFVSSFDGSGNATFPLLTQVAADPTTALGLAPKQYVDAKVPYILATGGDAYVGTFSDIPALVNGQRVAIKIPAANTTTTPTFNLNGLGAVLIVMVNGSSPAIGTLLVNGVYEMVYDSASAKWVVVGINNVGGGATGVNAASGSLSLPATVGGVSKTFIVNWGTVAVASITGNTIQSTPITFATAYATAAYSVITGLIAGSNVPSASNMTSLLNGSLTLSGFTLQIVNTDSNPRNNGAYYIAIGV